MKNNVLKALSKNLGFKILAVAFAFTLWLTVYNLEDPTKTKQLTINVNIENKEAIDNMGKYYEVIEGTNRVSFSVIAARSILDKLDESDFVAVADMDKLSVSEDGTIGTAPIDIACIASNVNHNSLQLKSSSKELKVAMEDLMTKQFVVSPKSIGEVADGYALGGVSVTAPNVLTVAGPKSIVQEITSAVANVNVDGISDSWATFRVTPVLYDEEGNEIDTTRLTLSNETVNVAAEILNVKAVSVAITPTGKPAKGYTLTSITTNPETVLLKGDRSLLNAINSIEIPGRLLSVKGAEEDVTVSIDVAEYIPDGVELVNGENSTVEITANIGKIKDKVFSVETENIVVTGLATQWKLDFAHSSVAVTISGLEEDINELSKTTLQGSIDVTGLPVGMHMVELVLDLDDSKYDHKTIQVMITITDPNADVPETESETTTTEVVE